MEQIPQGAPYLMSLLQGGWFIRCAHAAASLTIPDVIGDGEKPVAAIAQELKTNEDFTYRLLRALVAGGIFEEVEPRKFKNNANSAALRAGSPFRDLMLLTVGYSHSRGWLDLEAAVRTGKSGIRQALGVTFWEYIEKNQSEFDIFNRAMISSNDMFVPVVAQNYDWSRFKRILDLGGGHGGVLKHLLPHNRSAQWAVADLPNVCAVANQKAPKELLDAGVQWIPTDFFVSVPGNFDAVVMKFILHDWGNEESKKILDNIRKGIPREGVVLCVETVVPEKASAIDTQDRMVPLMDINMMAVCEGGRERTLTEWKALAAGSGFRVEKVIPCPPSILSIIELIPV